MNDYGVIISKYFLTGVTPAFLTGISPLTATAIVSNNRSLHGICGFTESEVKAIVKHYLRKNDQEAEPLVHYMQRLYNGYYLAMSSYDKSNTAPHFVYNPHLAFHYLSNFQREGFVAKPEKSTAVHSTTVLKSISNVGEFSVNDLVELIVSKSVQSKIKTEFGYSELLSVLDRIAAFLRTQDKISALLVPAIRNLKAGRAEEFCGLLETFFSSRAVRSLQIVNEAVLQGIVELLLDEPSNRVPELHLVVDGSKETGKGRFGFVDIFIPRHATAIGSEQTCAVMELKNVTLEGLWKGATGRKYDYKALEILRKALRGENESNLLSRKYAHWSQGDGGITMTLESIMEAGVKRLQRYMQTIALGKVRSYSTSRVLGSRVNIDPGLDDLQGYVLMAIGASVTFPEIEDKVTEGFFEYQHYVNMTGELIRKKAERARDDLDISEAEFKASTGRWTHTTSDMENRSLSSKQPGSRKWQKQRVTVTLCSNGDGSEKLSPLVIGCYTSPPWFKNVNMNSLGCTYRHNTKANMTTKHFTEWLKSFDFRMMRLGKEKVILLLDSFAGHKVSQMFDLPELQCTKVIYLPANTTSKLQPLDAGSMKNFKLHYHKRFNRCILRRLEELDTVRVKVALDRAMGINRTSPLASTHENQEDGLSGDDLDSEALKDIKNTRALLCVQRPDHFKNQIDIQALLNDEEEDIIGEDADPFLTVDQLLAADEDEDEFASRGGR
ncbi:DDE superfamily endonuclease-domain-containing protein [Dissophora ornata]|nr:DDE superfamily endonuclease-domain-containing protein [Dissophora ornata]